MASQIPRPDEIRKRLERLSYGEVKAMCEARAVAFTTVWKLRSGETADPRLATVIAIWPDLKRVKLPAEPATAEQGA